MKIINISDIEDIVLAKYEIDTNNPECDGRSNLNDFIKTYCSLNDTIIIDDELISFNYIELFNNQYLFINDNNHVNKILDFLKGINFNYDHLQEIPLTELILNNTGYIIHNNKYYKI